MEDRTNWRRSESEKAKGIEGIQDIWGLDMVWYMDKESQPLGSVASRSFFGLRPARKPHTNEARQDDDVASGSRFNPLYLDGEEAQVDENIPNSGQVNDYVPLSPCSTRKGKQPVTVKQLRAVNVRKPLTTSVNDFPIIPRSALKASSSRSTCASHKVTILDKSRHFAIVLPENSNPNLQLVTSAQDFPSSRKNVHTMGDPPDADMELLPSLPVKDPGDVLNDSMFNDGGCAHPKFFSTARQYLRVVKPDLVVFVEPRVSGRKADVIIASLGFLYSHRVEAVGFSGGIWIAWFNSIKVDMELNHFNLFTVVSPPSVIIHLFWPLLSMVVLMRPNTKLYGLIFDSLLHVFLRLGVFNGDLLRMKSDHRSILLTVSNFVHNSSHSHFRYFSGWSSHNDSDCLVSNNWVPSNSLFETIISFTKATETWNKTTFGYIGTKKRMTMARLRGVQRALSTKSSRFLLKLESKLLVELENILDQDELLWWQKSRTDCILLGDRNTRYFHRRAVCRKQQNRVSSLWLLNAEVESNDDFPLKGMFLVLSPSVTQHFDDIPTSQEIHEALKEMAPLKGPGWDGLHAEFFQKQWKTVGPFVCNAIQHVFRGGSLEKDLNHTILVLLRKTGHPETFMDLSIIFFPRSLSVV
ncbi:hypothetical protein V6N13_083661 [Hibiscus sabdariffa]